MQRNCRQQVWPFHKLPEEVEERSLLSRQGQVRLEVEELLMELVPAGWMLLERSRLQLPLLPFGIALSLQLLLLLSGIVRSQLQVYGC